MLRDRCPKVVNYALKWRKAKEKWINHCYSKFIKIYSDKDQRNNATRLCLGIKAGKIRNFDFAQTIDWDNLDSMDTLYWTTIDSWVRWFMKNYAYIENTYSISKKLGDDYFTTEVKIIRTHLTWLLPSTNDTQEEREAKFDYVDRFAEYLMKCLEEDEK